MSCDIQSVTIIDKSPLWDLMSNGWGNTCCISKAQMTMHPMYNTVWSQVTITFGNTMEFHQRTRLPLETSMHWECVSAESVSMVSLNTSIYKRWKCGDIIVGILFNEWCLCVFVWFLEAGLFSCFNVVAQILSPS